MGLRDYEPVREEIMHRGQPLMSVRGLSLDDLGRLLKKFMPEIRQVLQLAKGASEEIFLTLQSDDFVVRVVSEVPSAAASVIAAASDEPDAADAAARLPASLQVAALLAIGRLTMEDMGGPKAAAATIRSLIGLA